MHHSPAFGKFLTGFIFFASVISSKNSCAQIVIGRWYQVSVKQYFTEGGAKKYGKSFLETNMSSIGTVVTEFKPDHTYITTSVNKDGASRTYTGSWSMNGNVLSMTDQKATSAINRTVTMASGVLTMETVDPDNKITRKVEIMFKKG